MRDLELLEDSLVRASFAINSSTQLLQKGMKQLEHEGNIVDKAKDVLEGVLNAHRQPTVNLLPP